MWYADVTFTSSTAGSFKAPMNMTPRIYSIAFNDTKFLNKTKVNRLGLEYIKLPEIHRIMPSSDIPSSTVS